MSIIEYHCSSVALRSVVFQIAPALFTTMSMRPNRSRAAHQPLAEVGVGHITGNEVSCAIARFDHSTVSAPGR